MRSGLLDLQDFDIDRAVMSVFDGYGHMASVSQQSSVGLRQFRMVPRLERSQLFTAGEKQSDERIEIGRGGR